MRKIEQRIIDAFNEGFDLSEGPSLHYSSWARDTVQRGPGSIVDYFLHGTAVARRDYDTIELGVTDGAWQNVTTKSRINAFARAYNLPSISQKDFTWTWTDGIPYTGLRKFPFVQRPVDVATYKADAILLWTFLAEHPDIRDKENLPKAIEARVERYKFKCPLCQLFINRNCHGCPLSNGRQYGCEQPEAEYFQWHDGSGVNPAAEVLRDIEAWQI